MPVCPSHEPDLIAVGDAEVRCLLYVQQAKQAV